MKTYPVPEEWIGRRLDAGLSFVAGLTRSAAARLIEEGHVTVSGVCRDKNYRMAAGDVLQVELPEPAAIEAHPENIPLTVVYEDRDILVINKESGMVVHPAPGNENGTLVNALLFHCRGELSGINGAMRPGIVHRIDKDTSGLLVVAKNDRAHQGLAAQLEGHAIRRVYHALVQGGFQEDSGTVDMPIGRSPKDRKKMAVLLPGQGHSRNAITHYTVLERFPGITYLSLELETGRTHQIRVHMAYKGHPLLGDETYGGGHTPFEKAHASDLSGQCLHAKELRFTHPCTGEPMAFTCVLPESFQHLLYILRQQSKD